MNIIREFLSRLWTVLGTVRSLIVAMIVLGLGYVTTIDSSLVPWDSIIGLFVKDETKLPSAVATATAGFTVIKWLAPTIMEGLRYLFNKPAEVAGSGNVDVPQEDLKAEPTEEIATNKTEESHA